MSRVDQALRRAAAEQTTEATDAESQAPRPVDGADVESLSREAFPVEIGVGRRTRPPQAVPAEPELSANDMVDQSQPEVQPWARTEPLLDRMDGNLLEKVVADMNMATSSREQYRRLAALLHDAQANTGQRAVMITSAVPGEGKTLTAINIALTLSESYRRRVLLIDADLRKPALHQAFRLSTTTGLIDGLESQTEVKLVVRQISANLWVLPAGRPTSDPMGILTSDRMRQVLDEAKEAFDWVIVDTPPLMMLTDAHLLTSLVDCAVLVVKANATAHELVKRTADIIGRNRVIGVVLNQATNGIHSTYDGYYGGYLAKPEDGRRS
jgi:capsular exopolysaccharide synthesis family protein